MIRTNVGKGHAHKSRSLEIRLQCWFAVCFQGSFWTMKPRKKMQERSDLLF